MYLFTHHLRASHTVTHPSFSKASLPEQAVVVEVLPNSNAKLANGIFLPANALTRLEMVKTWLVVANYPQRYLLSSHGKVVSLPNQGTTRERLLKVLRAQVYPAFFICTCLITKYIWLACLMTQHFLPPPADARLVCAVPKDGNRLNIKTENLQWVNPADVEDDLARQYMHRYGERYGLSKLTGREISRIRELSAAGHSKQRIANEFAVSRPIIL